MTNLNKLRECWYRKLSHSGFKDIEHINGDGSVSHLLKDRAKPSRLTNAGVYEAVTGYYSIAREFYWHLRGNEKPTRAWGMYCEGLTIREIARKMGWSVTRTHEFTKKTEKRMWNWWKNAEKEREMAHALDAELDCFEDF